MFSLSFELEKENSTTDVPQNTKNNQLLTFLFFYEPFYCWSGVFLRHAMLFGNFQIITVYVIYFIHRCFKHG